MIDNVDKQHIVDDDFDFDIQLNESALDDIANDDVYDNNFQDFDGSYAKVDFVLELRLQYIPLKHIYKDPSITNKIQDIVGRIGKRITSLIENSMLVEDEDDIKRIELAENLNSEGVEITDVEAVYKILNNNSVSFIRVTGLTMLYTVINKDYTRNSLERLYYSIAEYISKTGVKDLRYNRTNLTFKNAKVHVKSFIDDANSCDIRLVPDIKFDKVKWSFSSVMPSVNINTGAVSNKDSLVYELDREYNTAEVNEDFFFKKADDSNMNVSMLLSRSVNNVVQLYSITNAQHVTVNQAFKVSYNPYSNDAKSIRRAVNVLSNNLYDYIREHQDEIYYRTFIKIVNEENEINSITGCCLTNIKIIIGDLIFFLTVNFRSPVEYNNNKLSKEHKENLKNFINTMCMRYGDRNQLLDIINTNFKIKLK